MKRILIHTIIITIFLFGCADKQNTDKLEVILDLKLQYLFENAKNDGLHPDITSVYNALKSIRDRNYNFDKKDDPAIFLKALTEEINWYWLNTSPNDSILICNQIETLLNAKTKDDAVVEELKLFTILDNITYKSYYHFKSISPVVVGRKKELKVGENDTLRFMVAGISSTLKNSVFLGDIDSLKDSSYRARIIPIYDKRDNLEGTSYSEYILRPTTVGSYSLTGVMTKFVNGKQEILPFRYKYNVCKK